MQSLLDLYENRPVSRIRKFLEWALNYAIPIGVTIMLTSIVVLWIRICEAEDHKLKHRGNYTKRLDRIETTVNNILKYQEEKR